MARPIKNGVDYFPLDTFLDTKFQLIEAEFGLTGFAIIVKLFQKIYGEQGYYCEWTNEVALLFSRKVCEGCNVVSEIVSAAIKRGIFDKDLYEKYQILTSKGIQERYFEAVNRRVKVNVKEEYLLVNATQIRENVNINRVNVCRNSKNADRNTQSKLKESKLNKSKLDSVKSDKPTKHKYGKYKNVLLTDDEVKKLKDKYSDFQERLDYFSSRLEMKGYKYKSHYLAFLSWNKEDKNTSSFSLEEIKAKINKFD